MTSIIRAMEKDLDQLKGLWLLAFKEEQSFIEAYFQKRFYEGEIWVKKHGEQIIAMVTLMPMHVCNPHSGSDRAMMIYGFATHPDWQGQGVGKLFLQEILEMLWERSIKAVLLVPASPSLFEYYRGQGFRDFFYHYVYTYNQIPALACNGQASIFNWVKTDAGLYTRLRQSLLQGMTHVCFREEEVSFQKFLSQFSGADLYSFEDEDHVGCAAVECLPGEKLLIKEFLTGPGEESGSLFSLLNHFNFHQLEIRSPMSRLEGVLGKKAPFGMIVFREPMANRYNDQTSYLGLGFD